MKVPQITVIVPIYNVEQYLPRCIDSILTQTFTDFELLLIDDGSTDGSGKICDEYAKKDERIKVFHKQNGGVSSARNLGLDNAKGKWIYFSDADDRLETCGLQNLFNLSSDITDLIMGGYAIIQENGLLIKKTLGEKVKKLLPKEGIKEMYSPHSGFYQGYLWCKLFRKTVIDKYNHRFRNNIFYNEDRLFIFEFICYSKRVIVYSDIVIYNYFIRGNSAIGKLNNSFDSKIISDFEAFRLMKKCLLSQDFRNYNLVRLANKGIFYSYKRIEDKAIKHSMGIKVDYIHKAMYKEIGTINYCYFSIYYFMQQLYKFCKRKNRIH